jgi:Glyoxalase-like domain
MFELDHVVIAAADLEAAAVVLEERYGLNSVEGGPHPDWGTVVVDEDGAADLPSERHAGQVAAARDRRPNDDGEVLSGEGWP